MRWLDLSIPWWNNNKIRANRSSGGKKTRYDNKRRVETSNKMMITSRQRQRFRQPSCRGHSDEDIAVDNNVGSPVAGVRGQPKWKHCDVASNTTSSKCKQQHHYRVENSNNKRSCTTVMKKYNNNESTIALPSCRCTIQWTTRKNKHNTANYQFSTCHFHVYHSENKVTYKNYW
jgi:hypothetical protein